MIKKMKNYFDIDKNNFFFGWRPEGRLECGPEYELECRLDCGLEFVECGMWNVKLRSSYHVISCCAILGFWIRVFSFFTERKRRLSYIFKKTAFFSQTRC